MGAAFSLRLSAAITTCISYEHLFTCNIKYCLGSDTNLPFNKKNNNPAMHTENINIPWLNQLSSGDSYVFVIIFNCVHTHSRTYTKQSLKLCHDTQHQLKQNSIVYLVYDFRVFGLSGYVIFSVHCLYSELKSYSFRFSFNEKKFIRMKFKEEKNRQRQ